MADVKSVRAGYLLGLAPVTAGLGNQERLDATGVAAISARPDRAARPGNRAASSANACQGVIRM